MLSQYGMIRSIPRRVSRAFLPAQCFATHARINRVPNLADWNLSSFKKHAFDPKQPVILPPHPTTQPPACQKWFTPNGSHGDGRNNDNASTPTELNATFWAQHEDLMVPLELTTTTIPSTTGPSSSSPRQATSTFHRSLAPLKILLAHLKATTPSAPPTSPPPTTRTTIYLAQHPIPSLPPLLQSDLPTPSLILSAGKGDIYTSSIWLGRPPTYTPLHRDPNPNLLLQLAGTKIVRLLPPEIGNAVFEDVQHRVAAGQPGAKSGAMSAAFRGEEMMSGPERVELHRAVWGCDEHGFGDGEAGNPGSKARDGHGEDSTTALVATYAVEATLDAGEALFIPQGWWHGVKGVGTGVTASANWWFR